MRLPVLVVDDNEDVRDSLYDALEIEGFDVSAAANGEEALRRLRTGTRLPSIILLDLMMPVMDGTEFRTQQLRDPSIKGIPVILMSADRTAGRKAEALGVEACLSKPMDLSVLVDTIRRVAAIGLTPEPG